MKKTYIKYIMSSIKEDLSHLIAIFLIVFLGISFIVGLMSTSPDIEYTVDKYYKENNFVDTYIVSTIGFDEEDTSKIKEKIDDIDLIESHYQIDEYYYVNNKKVTGRLIYRTFEDNAIDKLTLIDGRFPSNKNECVALSSEGLVEYKIGDYITVDEEKSTIVGTVSDPFYIANSKDKTTIGTKEINLVCYFNESYFDNLNTSMIKITFKNTKDLQAFSKEYEQYITKKVADIETISSSLIENRKSKIKEKIKEEVKNEVYKGIVEKLMESQLINEETAKALADRLIENESNKKIINENTEIQYKKFLNENNPKWYVLTRNEIQGARMLKEDVNKVTIIGQILPIFFYLIGMLVSLSSMTRIIAKDRAKMGTLKSIGFTKYGIYRKYLFYGLIASVLGCVLGSILGIFILPYVISNIYRTLYKLPPLVFTFQTGIILGFSALMIFMIIGAISAISYSSLRETVSSLLIAKTPKAGRKILVEKIPFIRKHLKFKYKSMLRNIFRFKKNLLMIIVGVGGCVALLLVSFALKDSLSVVKGAQYKTIINYDFVVTVKDTNNNPFASTHYKNDLIFYDEGTVKGKEQNIDVSVLSSNKINDYVGFDDNIEFNENSVIITKQIAEANNITIGDYVLIDLSSSGHIAQAKVSAITTNYVSNYVYFGEAVFNKYFPNLEKNSFIVETGLKDEDVKKYSESLIYDENITAISSTLSTKELYGQILDNLDALIAILVLLCGALIAIVVYNLTDIIISERIKEIATLRVVGYFKREALAYIYREIVFMSFFGVIVGIIFGLFLHQYVIINIGSIGLVFGKHIKILSYVYSVGFAFVCILLTTFIFYPKIKKIQMAEALKSVSD